jgi:hypothetical protein
MLTDLLWLRVRLERGFLEGGSYLATEGLANLVLAQ